MNRISFQEDVPNDVPDDVAAAVATFLSDVSEAVMDGGVAHFALVLIGEDRTVSVHGGMSPEMGRDLFAAGAAQVVRDYDRSEAAAARAIC